MKKYRSKIWKVEVVVDQEGVTGTATIRVESSKPITWREAERKAKKIPLPKAHFMPVKLVRVRSIKALGSGGRRTKVVRYKFR